ncbi:MAG TPA: 1-deoxy-D-xylulose-5-phosphate reductoisomerase [Clostridia bacterium]|nr:1-deoxy-D-xylulose-5-phosphate reductoisomerase [Clostridia bacterium]HPQ45820.1 1-deoxy-D-xylulose-5-phosphate reductoisomerase [Clostridia bacterium]HRX42249.1 1-deoxy-D-xylulose-5-phosphate reductoisomerase [Clostridia bacterium]
MTKVCILGATGSIGRQALDVCREMGFIVTCVTADTDYEGLAAICRDYGPGHAAIASEDKYEKFKTLIDGVRTYAGSPGILECIRNSNADIVVNGIVGSAGIMPTLEAIGTARRVALANKETLVAAGDLIMKAAHERNVELIPVDSEHSAVFQCMEGNRHNEIDSIYLTASGGPFRGYSAEKLKDVTREMALRHPSWTMGSKITIDSATLMNKGLEVIEARWLFDMEYERIKVVVHPGSIVHSMVGFTDGSIIAQLGAPDMRIPIQYSLTYPKRVCNNFSKLDIYNLAGLQFHEPDMETFRCLSLAYEAGRTGKTMPCAMNAANEEAVRAFLSGHISFLDIPRIIEEVMTMHDPVEAKSIETILEQDKLARQNAQRMIKEV